MCSRDLFGYQLGGVLVLTELQQLLVHQLFQISDKGEKTRREIK